MTSSLHRRRFLQCIASLAFAATLVASAQVATPTPQPAGDPSVPAPQVGRPRFHELHESFLARGKAGPIGLLFLGDSITFGWSKWPEVWAQAFGKYQPANFGIGSDRTQNVLWRIEQGELDGIAPKVVVLMIGTNNSGGDTPDAIFAANKLIVQRIREKLPRTKVLVLAIFPRGPRHFNAQGVPRDDGVSRMKVIDAVNARLPELDDGRNVRVLNINHVFRGPDGRLPEELMYDQLHLTEAGYRRWADAIGPTIEEMMKN